jgi:hypothetical protein
MTGRGAEFTFAYSGPDTALAINHLLDRGARVSFVPESQVRVNGIARTAFEAVTRELGLRVTASEPTTTPTFGEFTARPPRIGLTPRVTGATSTRDGPLGPRAIHFRATTVHNEDLRRRPPAFRSDRIADRIARDCRHGLSARISAPVLRRHRWPKLKPPGVRHRRRGR